jgi:hypothetical protein
MATKTGTSEPNGRHHSYPKNSKAKKPGATQASEIMPSNFLLATRFIDTANNAAQWRATKGVQVTTDAELALPLKQPGWAKESRLSCV